MTYWPIVKFEECYVSIDSRVTSGEYWSIIERGLTTMYDRVETFSLFAFYSVMAVFVHTVIYRAEDFWKGG
jgi:hypothetical protein